MTPIESVKAVVAQRFQRVRDVGDGVLRAELVHGDKAYAIAYVDLSDSVVERSQDLSGFQEQLLGAEFFAPDNDFRWNSYMYFVAGPKSMASVDYGKAKAQIESDRHFARKFVLDADDFVQRLSEPAASGSGASPPVADAGDIWANLLRKAALGVLLEQPARKHTLEKIENGEAFQAEAAPRPLPSVPMTDPLARGVLRKLTIGSFRKANDGRTFEFGDVNLIVGSNGVGKTSLLEAIEALYCGRVRRDPDAVFSDIVGRLDTGCGSLETVKAPTTAAVLKARNTLWYGRADFQSSAISQGFSRFNFLDTDAAFRLSSEQKYEDIREDLGKLLVGPETAKLWDYLSKLGNDVMARLRNLTERFPVQTRAVELLEAEVQRLRNSPSEASTLLGAYLDALAQLPLLSQSTDNDPLDERHRETLAALLKALRAVQVAVSTTPVTQEKISQRESALRRVLEDVKALLEQRDICVGTVAHQQMLANKSSQNITQLDRWLRLLEGNVPDTVSGLETAEARASTLQRVVGSYANSSVPLVVSEQYVGVQIGEAGVLASERLSASLEYERSAEVALTHSIELGQSLEALRRDLHDVAITYVQRSGEDSVCPICKTGHLPSELAGKLEALIASQEAVATDSLRRNAQSAKDETKRCRQDVDTLAALAKFAEASGIPPAMNCGSVGDALREAVAQLEAALVELQSRRAAFDHLDLLGIDWSGWEGVRDAASSMLPQESSVLDASGVRQARDQVRRELEESERIISTERDKAEELTQAISERVSKELGDSASGLSAEQQIVRIERALQQTERAVLEMNGIAQTLRMLPDASVEFLQDQVESCLVAYDKARHGFQSDAKAKEALEEKLLELAHATGQLASDMTARENLQRAADVLSGITVQHSLDAATAEAFDAIKGNVSAIFSRIHSPREYELGDFSNESLIIRRDSQQAHAVSQVSTGQRAALALSIFLALNNSASSAPPVILIDDPVAHIDDLNTLSFLDYLRDVALGSRKQVFFATADIRLAALFQRKFDFLGKDRFKRIALTR